MYITEQEIMSQHEALAQTAAYMSEHKQAVADFFGKYRDRRVVFMGCGSSYMLSQSGARAFGKRGGAGAIALAGGDFLVTPDAYRDLLTDSVLVILSRSGMTSEIIRAVEIATKTTNTAVLSVTMKEQNDLMPYCEFNLLMPWAYDHSVCQTRTVTNLYASLLLLDAYRSNDTVLERSVLEAVRQDRDFLTANREALAALAGRDFTRAIVLADGAVAGLAQEAALAFTEICMLPGSCFNILDYRHGPIVLHGTNTMTLVAVQPEQGKYQQDMLDDLARTGCILVTFSSGSAKPTGVTADFHVDGIEDFAACGILFIYLAQMIAYEKAIALDVNPDQPKGLNAYITLK